MLRLALPLLAFALTGASAEQRIDIGLANFKFTPSTIALQHGQPYVLHLTNHAGGGHSFAAKAFFAAAAMSAAERAKVAAGKIELGGGESADVHFIAPAAGTYKIVCTHFLHTSFGMTGSFVVS